VAVLRHWDVQSVIKELVKILLTSKAPAWIYEEEVRIIRDIKGVYAIPREVLSHVIFGLQTIEADEALIHSVADKYYKNVKFGKVVRTNDDFGITVEDI